MSSDERLVLDSNVAYDLAFQEAKGRELAVAAGVPSDVLSEVVDAHGQRWSVGEAFVACEPFARMLEATAGSEYIPKEHRTAAIRDIIQKSAKSNQATENVPDAVRVRVEAVAASNESVKKNS